MRRSFALAALGGSLLALVPALWMVGGPGGTLVQDVGMFGAFYDVQGRALLDGHLHVPPASVGLEGIETDGRTQLYFGLVPSILRLPVLAVTDGLDGRLTQLSMLGAFLVLLAGAAVLHWRVRALVLEDRAIGRAGLAAAFGGQLLVGGGVALYLLSQPTVYHEAELWGAAFSVAAFAAITGVVRDARVGTIAAAGVLTTLAVNTRFSVGLGPVVASLLLAAAQLRSPKHARTASLLVAAALVPLALHAAVNLGRFEQPLGIPFERQVHSRTDPDRRAALAANDGGLFGLKFVPTTVVQAARPDALGTLRGFPFVGLPAESAAVLGDVRFELVEPSLSAVTSMPALCVLSVVALWSLWRRPRLRPLVAVVAGAAAGFALTLTIATVTTRYLADFLPFLLLAGFVGLCILLDRPRRPVTWAALGALVLVGGAVNGAVGLTAQRLYEAPEGERARFVTTQSNVDRLLGRRAAGVRTGPVLPSDPPGRPGDLFVVDRCAALYAKGLAGQWLPVERTDRSGFHRLLARFPPRLREREEALMVLGTGPRRVLVTARRDREATALAVRVGKRTVGVARPRLAPGRPVPLLVALYAVPRSSYVAVSAAGRPELSAKAPYDRQARVTVGADPGGTPRFSGTIAASPASTPACDGLVARLRG